MILGSFPWRLWLNRLAVQVALLIIVAIITFQTILIIMFHVLEVVNRRHIVDQSDFIASVIIALDVAELSHRDSVISAFARAAPYADIAIMDSRPPVSDPVSARDDLLNEEIHQVASLLWDGVEVFGEASATRAVLAVGLRKGGYALICIAQRRKPPRSIWRWLWQPELPDLFILAPLARAALLFFIFAAIFVFWTSNAIMAPLRELAKHAEGIPDDVDRDKDFAERGPQEVRELTSSINRMQARIRKMIAMRAHVLAAVSHDLRTIITRLKLKAEFIQDRMLQQKMLRDIDLMDGMLYKNLQYLRAESHDRSAISLIDLDSVLQTVANEFCDLGHCVEYRGGGRQMILGSLSDVQRIFTNLVENATHHAKTVEISIDNRSETHVRVDVIDDGPGISAEIKEHAFEPFTRGEPARTIDKHSGFGLGLSIVHSLVEHHGGTVRLLDRKPHGLIVRVSLPRSTDRNGKM